MFIEKHFIFMFLLQACSYPQHRYLGLVTFLVALSGSFSAVAASDEVFSPYLDFSVIHEDNLLRFHDTASALAVTGSDVMADTIKRTTAGLRINKIISQQTLIADLSMSRNRYSHFSQYDYAGKDASANWGWRLGSHVSGNLGGSYTEGQTPFQDFRAIEPNINRQRRENFDAAWQFHPSWRVRGGYSQYALAYDLAVLQYNDRKLATTEFGLDFIQPSNSTVGVQLRHIRGEYPNNLIVSIFSVDNNYSQNEFKGKVDWRVSETASIQFLGGLVRKNYDALTKRNFSGTNSRLVANWSASAKLNLNVNAWNEVGSSSDLSANFSTNRGVSSDLGWELASKVRVNASLRGEHRDYTNASAVTGVQALERKDTYTAASLGLSYMPIRHLQLSASLANEVLSSNFERNGYRANKLQFNGRYDLGLD